MTKPDWKKEIEVAGRQDGLDFFWFDETQLRQSVAFLAALVRTLESLGEDATIGVRERRVTTADGQSPAVYDLARLREAEVEFLRGHWIQEATVTIDGVASEYTFTAEGVGRGAVSIIIPPARYAQFDDTITELITRWAGEHDAPFRPTWPR